MQVAAAAASRNDPRTCIAFHSTAHIPASQSIGISPSSINGVTPDYDQADEHVRVSLVAPQIETASMIHNPTGPKKYISSCAKDEVGSE
jgi:hypothetical protein